MRRFLSSSQSSRCSRCAAEKCVDETRRTLMNQILVRSAEALRGAHPSSVIPRSPTRQSRYGDGASEATSCSRRSDHFFLRNKQMGERWGERTGRALERRSSQPPRDFVAVKREYRRGQQQQKRQEKSPPSPLFLLLVCLFWVGLFFFLYMKWWTL